MIRPVACLLLLGLLAGCEAPEPITSCESGAGMTPDCRFQNPEDLAALPGDAGLLVSQMGQMDGSVAGDLALYMPGGAIDVLFPGPALTDDRSWGDASCAPPDEAAFSPHGIDLLTRADGRLMLLVVNHGGRESVEFFEVTAAPVPALTWRGCAEDPGNAAFNDVVGRSDGGFYVTHMFPQDGQMGAMLQGALLGSDTGHVYAWSPEGGWSVVPGSEGPFPNGIELAEDESALYINMYLAGEVRKLDLETGEVLAVYAGGNPDNSTWAADGRLLVATHIAGLTETTACQDIAEGSCGFAFRIVALDPESLAAETVLEHGGAPMGGATVALEVGETLYLGTFAGDRIVAYRP